ncbi:MAG TPA: aldose 1-epimerase [Candidatus Binatia bacterium]|jgi:galactose mutarotase-like enzyme
MTATILNTSHAGFASVTLVSPDARLRAAFIPSLNMLGCSLEFDGEELLHLRAGVQAYADSRKTCGIPLLHPWANRLAGNHYRIGGQHVALVDDRHTIPRDANGLPIHGLLSGRTPWSVTESTTDNAAALDARFDFSSSDLLANFPFPHLLQMHVRVRDGELTISTVLTPTSERSVPVSFGYHPYFRIPAVQREDWVVTLPVRKHLILDAMSIPTGRTETVEIETAPLGERAWDDCFTSIVSPGVFAIEGGRRRIEVELGRGYPFVQLFAPSGSDFLAIEPMTAPANALVSDHLDLGVAPHGDRFEATFTIRMH